MSEKHKKMGIGLIGAGAIMKLSHAPTVKRSEIAQVSAVYDTNLARATALADEFGAKAYHELEAIVADAHVEAVIVATPNRFHAQAVIAAAQHGKHVLCEKPLTIDIAEAHKVVKACEEAGIVLQIGFNQRFWNQVQIAKELIDQGVIGTIHQVRSQYLEPAAAYPAATQYRYDLALSGGATILDLTTHRVDLVRHLVGNISGVFAEIIHSELPQIVDDNVWLLTRFDNGARGCLSGNRFSPHVGDGTDIYGTQGTIHITTETINPFASAPLAIYTEKPAQDLPDILHQAHYPDCWWKSFCGGWLTLKPPRENPYDKQLQAFHNSIRENKPALITGEDGLKTQEVVQAAYMSMRAGKWIDLPLSHDAPFMLPEYY